MLELRNVCKRFSGIPAVDNVSFMARPGEVTGYLGPNGSGKSTTMKMITGLIERTSGEILFDGQPIQRDPIAFKRRMGYVPEEPHLYPHLTGLEYLVMVGRLRNCRARNLKTSTVASYEKTLEHLEAFCGAMHVDQTDLALLTDFRASRHVKASTSGKELETLRAFCAFAKKRSWIAENYARELDPPREDGPPTLPFGADEVEKILGACGKLEDDNPNTRERTRNRARALCLVMLYSGMRISDTIQLKRAAVDLESGKLLLRVMKTGAPFYVRLGPPAIQALRALPAEGEYFFWNGQSQLSTAIGNARKTISRVLAVAGIEGHPHRFRDTFSVSLLEKGEDLRTVQLLLGHTSIKTTEKHYAPFVESFQRILDAATAKLDFGQNLAHPGTKIGTTEKNGRKPFKIQQLSGGSQWESNPPATQGTAQRV